MGARSAFPRRGPAGPLFDPIEPVVHPFHLVDCESLPSCNLCISTRISPEEQANRRGDTATIIQSDRSVDGGSPYCDWCFSTQTCMSAESSKDECPGDYTGDPIIATDFRCEFNESILEPIPRLNCYQMESCSACLRAPYCLWFHNANRYDSIFRTRQPGQYSSALQWQHLFDQLRWQHDDFATGHCMHRTSMEHLESHSDYGILVADPAVCIHNQPTNQSYRVDDQVLGDLAMFPLYLFLLFILMPPLFYLMESTLLPIKQHTTVDSYMSEVAAHRLILLLTEVKELSPTTSLKLLLLNYLDTAQRIFDDYRVTEEGRRELDRHTKHINIVYLRDLKKLRNYIRDAWKNQFMEEFEENFIAVLHQAFTAEQAVSCLTKCIKVDSSHNVLIYVHEISSLLTLAQHEEEAANKMEGDEQDSSA